ncbi:MAG: hypothetical protein WD492_05235 [Alkalispirochaeta sp.]
MKQLLKKIIKKTPLYTPLRNSINARKRKSELINWERNGKPVPPPHLVKQRTIRSFAEKYELKILIETGTYYGEMVEAMKRDFNQIYSIELSKELYMKAKQRFDRNGNIRIIHGDSGVELGKLVTTINEPILFWLDGHYSAGVTAKGDKDTPIYEELEHIFNSPNKGHVIIIDDARIFGTDPAYPSIEELSKFVRTKRPDTKIEVENDSIRILPRRAIG